LGSGIQAAGAAVLVVLGALRLAPSVDAGAPEAQVAWAVQLSLIAFAQELVFRGWLLRAVAPLGFWPAAGLTSLAFAAIHFGRPGETPAGLGGLVMFGLLAAMGVRRTGTLWWAVGFHAAWNVTQDVVLGLPDGGSAARPGWLAADVDGPAWLTGGGAGPEGGAPPILLMLLSAALLTRCRTHQP
jgi:membrane protease YdiL (CAAX protease family)